MDLYISARPVVYISIQSWHLNYFRSISVTWHNEKMQVFVTNINLVTLEKKSWPHSLYVSVDRLLGKPGVERYINLSHMLMLITVDSWSNRGSDELSHQSFATDFLQILVYHLSVIHCFPFFLSLSTFHGRHGWSAGDLLELVNNSSHLSPSALITAQCLFPYL